MKLLSIVVLFLNFCHIFCIFRNKPEICNEESNIKFIRAYTTCYVLKAVALLNVFSIGMYCVCAARDYSVLNVHIFIICSFVTIVVMIQSYIYSVTSEATIQKCLRKLFQVYFKIEKLQTVKAIVLLDKTLNVTIFSVPILGVYILFIYFFYFDFLTGTMYNIGYTLPKIILIANTMIFVNCLIILRHNFQILNRHISSKHSLKQIIEGVNIYCKLTRLSAEINQCFGYQNLMIIAYYVMWVAFETYHLVLVFLQSRISHSDIKLMQFSFSWIVINMAIIFVMCTICQNVQQESKSLKQKLWHLATFMDKVGRFP